MKCKNFPYWIPHGQAANRIWNPFGVSVRYFQATGARWKSQIRVSEGKRSLALCGLHLDVVEAVGPVLPVSFSLGTVPFLGEKLASHIARIHEWFILTRTRSKHSNRPSLALRSAALLTKTYSRLLNTMKSYEAFRKELTFDRPKRIV